MESRRPVGAATSDILSLCILLQEPVHTQEVFLSTEACGVPGLTLYHDFVTPEEEQASSAAAVNIPEVLQHTIYLNSPLADHSGRCG